jgi:S-adenosylmethionine decarboxylase
VELFGFGSHLIIEGHHANSEVLNDPQAVYQALERLTQKLEMTVVLAPHISQLEGLTPQDRGISGVVMIAESHISIHTFPERGFVHVDIFSVQHFDVQQAVAVVVEHFEVGRYDTHFINRGKEFPKDLEQVERIVLGEREYLETRLS